MAYFRCGPLSNPRAYAMLTASVRLAAPSLAITADLAVGAPTGDESEHRTLAGREGVALPGVCGVLLEPDGSARRDRADRPG